MLGRMTDWPFASPIKPMKARVKETPPQGDGWVYEPKWDGFRAIAWGGAEPLLESRNGKPLLRYFPELLPALEQLPAGTVIDGEVVVVVDDVTQFDQLQLRIHPAASRIERLSGEIPAELVAFDLLAVGGEDLRSVPLSERRDRLEELFSGLEFPWHLTPVTRDFAEAERWFTEFEGAGCDGIICKLDDGAYVEDKRVWIKWKHRRDCDCVVGGYRVHKDGDKIGSILLGLFNDEGNFHFMGHCSGFSDHDRVELLRQFEQIRSDESFGGDGGVRVPGAQSRWSTGKELDWIPVTPGVVVQISYDQLEGGRFRHATRFERWRPDKPADECTLDQLERPEGVGFADVVDTP
jgi:ATP-dependent DNA ligase